jgi:hypothetical protein
MAGKAVTYRLGSFKCSLVEDGNSGGAARNLLVGDRPAHLKAGELGVSHQRLTASYLVPSFSIGSYRVKLAIDIGKQWFTLKSI